MGCFWSCEEDSIRCQYCSRKADDDDGVCVSCRNRTTRQKESIHHRPHGPRYQFGEFRCSCKREWTSRRSWPNKYQICHKCRSRVYAHKQRKLRPGDMRRDRVNVQDHPQELCQMCIELGFYCGKLRF